MPLKGNNYAFIDSQNLNLGIRSQGWVLDFERFRIYLKDKYAVCKAFLFIGYIPKRQNLYELLANQGYELIFKPTVRMPNNRFKGNVDAELVLHAMIEYNRYDKAIIASGDGDFYCLVNYLVKNDKLGKLLVPNSRIYSGLLKNFAPNQMEFLDNLKVKLQKTPR